MTFIELLLLVYIVILHTKDWLTKKVEYYLWDLAYTWASPIEKYNGKELKWDITSQQFDK